MKNISLIRPRYTGELLGAMSKTLSALTGTLPANWKITQAVGESVIIYYPLAVADDGAYAAATAAQTNKSREVQQSMHWVYLYCSDMIDELNRNIRRRLTTFSIQFRAQDRNYYGIAVDDETLPRMKTRNEIVSVANRLIEGEKNRIAAGKPALVFTTFAMLQTQLNYFLTKENEYIPLKDATRTAERKMKARREEGFVIYDNVVSDLRSTLRDETKEGFRDIAADWGVIFRGVGYDSEVYSHVMSYVVCDEVPVNKASVMFVDQGLEFFTDHYGNISTNKVKAGLHHVIVSCPGYSTVDIPEFKVELNIDNIIKAELEMVLLPTG